MEQIDKIKTVVTNALMQEWIAQGHFMTGKAVSEIEYVVEETFGQTRIIGNMPAHGVYMDQGVPASRIPFAPGSGAGKSAYISGLIAYVQKRMNISDMKKAKSIAFAIAHTHKKRGMPSPGSYAFTQTGKRTDWINDAILKNTELIGEIVRRIYREFMEAEFTNVLRKNKIQI